MKNRFLHIFRVLVSAIVLSAALCPRLQALPASRYAASSALAEGNWAKVKVTAGGMQFVSNSQLSSMGFSDPSKVRVYGFGGRIISETLDDTHPDDLPALPVVRTSGGILFFGVDHIRWSPSTGASNYTHTMQPYAEESFYFLSDRNFDGGSLEEIDLSSTAGLPEADSFVERLLHEKDLYAPSVTGRTLLGEDLRSQQQLNFSLPGNVGGDASVTLAVGSKVSGSTGTVRLTSSNSVLDQSSLRIETVSSSEQFMRLTTGRINASGVKDNLNLGLSFTTSGVISLVRLDYAEVEYERLLSLPADQLYFYFNEEESVGAVLNGVTPETEIWDVTEAHRPRKVRFALSGAQARFRVDPGYREFVAFNPSKVSRAVEPSGSIANQDIHSMESPHLLIISPPEYLSQAERLADFRRSNDGMKVAVLTPEQIYNEFSSGTPDVSAFRKAMKMWYDRDLEIDSVQTLKYCLIMSRPTYDNKMATPMVKNAGYPRVPIWQSASGYTENTSYSTDDYIGMLDDNDTPLKFSTARIRVAVGRFPVRSLEEARTAVDKIIAYTTNPEKKSWRNNVMLIADDQDNGQHLSQTEGIYSGLTRTAKGADYQYERLYLDNFERRLSSVGYEYPGAKKRLLSKFEEGQALVTYIGHANTVSWTHEHLLTWTDFNSFSNTRLPILYAATCEFARWDADEQSGGELLWAYPKSGVIAMICPSRSVFINMNGNLSAQFGRFALLRNEDGTPTRLGDAYLSTKNAIVTSDDNKLRYALLGDPSMSMPVFSYDVVATSIYGTDVTDPGADLPVVEARSNPVVKGVVTDHNGEVASDFNGFIFVKLYDAEKVIETLGNGDAGAVMTYNDRKTKLFEGAARVENGEWELTVYMPMEIENNFTPGRMTFYALADDGREASGSSEKFYVYGFDADAPDDNRGPDIINFYLNREGFSNGDLTYKTPVVYATVSDESGINISDAGIGHALMLTLDDATIYSDILNFYTPDLFDSRKGSVVYQLPEIPAGKHKLTLSVWDCANNSTYATLEFNVAAVKEPDIYDIGTSFSADSSGVEFIINSDRPLASLTCELEVFDINGVRMWHNSTSDRTDSSSSLRLFWDYTTAAGNRVAKGIYLCRATVVSPEGKKAVKSKKIVISH